MKKIKGFFQSPIVAAGFLGLSLLGLTQVAKAGVSCKIEYINAWNTGYQMDVSVTNTGNTPVNGWQIALNFAEPPQITNYWNAMITGNTRISASNLAWNAQLNPGQKTSFGFQGNHDGSFIPPVCADTTSSSSSSSSAKSSSSNSSSSSVSSSSRSSSLSSSSFSSSSRSSSISSSSRSSSSSSSSSSQSSIGRLDNPFVDAHWYIDPIWSAKATGEPGGLKVAQYSTAVWMDRIGAIDPTETGTMGLREHLDAAIDQNANLIKVVIYDLPNRDCFALASNGELLIAQDGFNRYKNEYITPIVNIFKDPIYKDLRIIAIIEPDSLPNLVTNISTPKCQEAAGPGGYREATQYTLNQLYPLKNVYSYVDIGHSGWLGWSENLSKASRLIGDTIKGTQGGVNSVAGFISNTANSTPLKEPFINADLMFNGNPVRSAKFYEWNSHFGEISYVQAFRQEMIAQGFPSSIGMLIDTSRNGWGGTTRPKVPSTSSVLDTYVNESRIDRRSHRGMWCNQASGIGERPTVAPEPGIDAYVWIKPPGESDGVAMGGIIDPTDPAKGFDRFCDPTFVVPANGQPTGAMPGAPHAGRWFPEGFKVLLEKAYPPLQ